MRNKPWAEAFVTAVDVENLLVSSNHNNTSYKEFFDKEAAKPEALKQFGEMGVIKTTKKIQGKLENCGIAVMHLGGAPDHPLDAH